MTESLDVTRHRPEEFLGKAVEINGVSYTLLSLIKDGSKSYVYVAKNRRSGLCRFVIKIFKYPRESEEGRLAAGQRAYLPFVIAFTGVRTVHSEVHEFGGALLRLEPYIGSVDEPEECWREMGSAAEVFKTGDVDAAVRAFEAVLELNPFHTGAMYNIACCHRSRGFPQMGYPLLMRAIEIDCNDRAHYQLMAHCLAQVGNAQGAVAILKKTLDRWALDYESWQLRLEIALAFDLTAIVEEERARLAHFARSSPDGSFLRFDDELERRCRESRQRRETYEACVSQAYQLQVNRRLPEARELNERAIATCQDNRLARINWCVTRYHLGAFEGLSDDLNRLLMSTGYGPNALGGAVAVTMMLANWRCNDLDLAGRVAKLIESKSGHPIDLPCVPHAVASDGAVVESRTSQEILDALSAILAAYRSAGADAAPIAKLIDLYQQRDALLKAKSQ